MNDLIFHNPGVVDLTTIIWLQDALSGAYKTGVTLTDLDLTYMRVEDDNDVVSTGPADISALSNLTDDHADNSMKEIGNGAYRLDIPDAAVAGGAVFCDIIIWDAASDTILPCPIKIQMNMVKILKPDWFVDRTQTPWELVYHCPGNTAVEYKRVQLKTVSGANITSTGIAIGQHVS